MKRKHFDSLGRIHIPKVIRDRVGWTEKTALKISADAKRGLVVIEKEICSCFICNGTDELMEFENDVLICKRCVEKIKGI